MKNKKLFSIWIVGIAVFIYAIVLLFNKFIFFDGDTIRAFYPYALVLQKTGLGWWTSSILSGHTLAASFQIGVFNPVWRIFLWLFGLVYGYNLLIILYIFLSFIFTYLFCKRLNFSKNASLFSALVFSLSQEVVHWAGNLAVNSATIVLPVAFLAANTAFNEPKGSRKYLIFFSIILGVSFLGSQQQFLLMGIIAASCYGLFLSIEYYILTADTRKLINSWLVYLLSILGGILIGLPQIFYSFKFTGISTRFGGLSWANASAGAATLLDFIKFVIPDFSFRYFISAEFLPYLGILPLFLAILAMVKCYKDKRVIFFSFTTLFVLLLTIKYSPLFWAIQKLPVIEYFRGPARWIIVGSFSLSIVAGLGLDYTTLNFNIAKKFLGKFIKILFIIIASVSIITMATFYLLGNWINSFLQRFFDQHLYSQTTKLPLTYYHDLIFRIVNDSFANFSILRIGFVFSLIFIFISFLLVKHSVNVNRFINLVIIISVVNLLVFGFSGLSFANSREIKNYPEIAKYLKNTENNPFSYRVFTFLIGMASSQEVASRDGSNDTDVLKYNMDGLVPSSNIFWGIQSIDGYEPMAPRRGQKMLAFLGSEVNQFFPSLANEATPLPNKISVFVSRFPLLSMMNVKYLISAYELSQTPNLKLVYTAHSTRFNVPIYLYENEKVLPRIYLANNITYLPSDEIKNFDIITREQDFSKNTYIECQTCSEFRNFQFKNDSITISKYQDGFLSLSANINNGRWLVFSESNLPGWQATIDGQPVSIYTANYLYQGVYVPSGNHDVEFRYGGIGLIK